MYITIFENNTCPLLIGLHINIPILRSFKMVTVAKIQLNIIYEKMDCRVVYTKGFMLFLVQNRDNMSVHQLTTKVFIHTKTKFYSIIYS